MIIARNTCVTPMTESSTALQKKNAEVRRRAE